MMENKRTTELPSTKLKWARPPPRILVTAESASFDKKILQALQSEGFQISYLRYDGDRKAFGNNLYKIAEPLGLGDYWAIVGAQYYDLFPNLLLKYLRSIWPRCQRCARRMYEAHLQTVSHRRLLPNRTSEHQNRLASESGHGGPRSCRPEDRFTTRFKVPLPKCEGWFCRDQFQLLRCRVVGSVLDADLDCAEKSIWG
jgi:hypothetical protein